MDKFKLIVDYIKDKETTSIDNLTMNDLKLFDHHSLLPLVYNAVKKYNIQLEEQEKNFLKDKFNKQVFKVAIQEAEKASIIEKFENKEIDFCFLKGSVLKYLYPSLTDRTMADNDILIRPEHMKKAHQAMLDLGYNFFAKGEVHDVFQKPPVMDIELHKCLVDDRFEKIADYYLNIWDVVRLKENTYHYYEMTKEDFYIHMIVHLGKHYSNGGIGFRFLIDVYLFLNKYKDVLNFDYIKHEQEKINIRFFSNNIESLVNHYFNNEELSELEKQMLEYILMSGTYGTTTFERYKNIGIEKKGVDNYKVSKMGYLLRRLFPPFSTMKKRNPILKKLPILLPFIYIGRIIKGIFKRQDMIAETITGLENFNIEEANKIKDLHEKSGM